MSGPGVTKLNILKSSDSAEKFYRKKLIKKYLDTMGRKRKIEGEDIMITDVMRKLGVPIVKKIKTSVPVSSEYLRVLPHEGSAEFGGRISYTLPQYGNFLHDIVIHVRLEGLSISGTSTGVKYADFLGHKIFKRVELELSNKLIDSYDSDTYNMHYQFEVKDEDKDAWKRSIGQEIPQASKVQVQTTGGTYSEYRYIAHGPQTFKESHDVVDLYIPLLFWFCDTPDACIGNGSIPYGQSFIRIDLAKVEELVSGIPTNEYNPPNISIMDMYVNNIFMEGQVEDVLQKYKKNSMIRLHSISKNVLNTPAETVQLGNLRYPVERLYMGAKPLVNKDNIEDWYKFYNINEVPIRTPLMIPNPGVPPPTHILSTGDIVYKSRTETIREYAYLVYGNEVFTKNLSKFASRYLPLKSKNLGNGEGIGTHMNSFAITPKNKEITGYFPLSDVDYLYLDYESDNISTINSAELYVCAITLNFLCIRNGRAHLVYNG